MAFHAFSGSSGVMEGLVFFPLRTISMNLVLFLRLPSQGNQLLRYFPQTPHRCSTPSELLRVTRSMSVIMMVLEVAKGKQYFLMMSSSLQMVTWASWQRISDIFEFLIQNTITVFHPVFRMVVWEEAQGRRVNQGNHGLRLRWGINVLLGRQYQKQTRSYNRLGMIPASSPQLPQQSSRSLNSHRNLPRQGGFETIGTFYPHSALTDPLETSPEGIGLNLDEESCSQYSLKLPCQSGEYFLTFEVGSHIGQEDDPSSHLTVIQDADPFADVPLTGALLQEVKDTDWWGQQSEVEGSGAANDAICRELIHLKGGTGGLQFDVDVDLLTEFLLLQLQQLEEGGFIAAVVPNEVDGSSLSGSASATHISIIKRKQTKESLIKYPVYSYNHREIMHVSLVSYRLLLG